MGAHIIDNSVTFGHQASDRRSLCHLTVTATQITPKRSYLYLKLVEAEKADAVQQRIQVVHEPSP